MGGVDEYIYDDMALFSERVVAVIGFTEMSKRHTPSHEKPERGIIGKE